MATDFRVQRRREETFQQGWSHAQPSIQEMAEAGFIFTGPGDTVECYACGVRIDGWESGSDPRILHQERAPDCPLLFDDGASSVVSGATGYSGATGFSDDSGLGDMQRRAPSSAATRLPTIPSSEESTLSTGLSVRTERPNRRRRPPSPAPPRYKQVSERQKSFYGVDWPPHLDAQPDKLVKAGLYYVGPGDRVKCAFCGGKLKNWLPKDSAIEEHIRHYPECSFVQNIEKQTAVLSKNIRSKGKAENCISSDELMKQYAEERANAKKPSAKTLWRTTLKKMGYSENIIKKAEKRCKSNRTNLNLNSILGEIHILEKEIFFGSDDPEVEVSDEGVESGEEEEEATPSTETLDVDERVRKLEQELKAIESERTDLQNQMVCKICLSNPSDTLFLTCRHFCTCHECAERVRDCPVCRQVILGTVDVFMV